MKKLKRIFFKDLNEIKSYGFQSQDRFIFVVSDTPKFIDFIGVDRFDSIASSYLVNLYNCIKTKKKEIQADLFIPLKSFKYGKKIKRPSIPNFFCLAWKISDFKDELENKFASSGVD